MDTSEERRLELDLRAALTGVELVCEASISDDQVQQAEGVVRSHLYRSQYDELGRTLPATLVTYFVRRGAEIYDRNELWEPLGVTEQSSRAGQAFLEGLRRLGLPNFGDQIQRAGARRFVAPILIHGALPASVAHQLVECVEEELRYGIVDAEECRRHLLRRGDLVQLIRRPAARLLDWVPSYAVRMLDAVIEHIEHPDGDALARLPIHLQAALRKDAERRRDLRRLQVPRLEFAYWSGDGPQVIGVGGRHRWQLSIDGEASPLSEDASIEVHPDHRAFVSGAGRQIVIWAARPVTFFDLADRVIPDDAPIPPHCVALLPRNWRLTDADGAPIDEGDEGAALSGEWSGYRSFITSLDGVSEVFAGPPDDPRMVRRLVHGSRRARLTGPVCEVAHGVGGGPVFTETPSLEFGDGGSEVGVTVTVPGRPGRRGTIHRSPATGSFALDDVLPPSPFVGSLQIDGVAEPLDLIVVPALEVDAPSAVLGPGDDATVRLSYIASDGQPRNHVVVAEARASEVVLPVDGIAAGAIVVALPRVQWSLRASQSALVDFADGVIRTTASELAEDLRLLVRSGIPAKVGAVLYIDGVERQRLEAKATRPTGPGAHHRSFDLNQLRDTIRHHAASHLDVRLEVDSQQISAIVCGDLPVDIGERTWAKRTPGVLPPADTSALAGLEWSAPGATGDVAHDPLYRALKAADTPDAVVTFLRTLGQRQANWKGLVGIIGAGADEWKRLDDIAHALWGLSSVRHREFSGDQRERLRRWAGTRRERCRKAPERDRREMEKWLARHYPNRSTLTSWANGNMIVDALPTRTDVTSEWLPGTVLFHTVSLVGGDHLCGPVVEEAVGLAPAITLEAVAFILEALHNGTRILPVPPAADDDEDGDEDDVGEPATQSPAPPPVLLSFDGCEIATSGRDIIVTPLQECAPPTVRLHAGAKAKALVTAERRDDAFVVQVPADLSGHLGVQLVDPRAVTADCSPQVNVELPAAGAMRRPHGRRIASLEDLAAARLHGLVMDIASAAAHGVYPNQPIEDLFDDPQTGAMALVTAVNHGATQSEQDLALISCLPMAFLFSPTAPPAQLRSNPLAWAVLGPRNPSAWMTIGWPNGQAFYTPSSFRDLPGFIHRSALHLPLIETPTNRYAVDCGQENWRRLEAALVHAESQGTPSEFLDIVVATHRMLAVDPLIEEAFRMVTAAYVAQPRTARAAVICGVAAFLACAA